MIPFPSDAAIKFHSCSYGEFGAKGIVGPALWTYHDLLTVHEGRLEVEICGGVEVVDANEAILIYPNTAFHGTAGPRSPASVVHFELLPTVAQIPDLEFLYGRERAFEKLTHDQDSLRDLERLIREPAGPTQTGRRLALLTLILRRPAQAYRMAGAADFDERLQPAILAVQNNLNAPPSITELAALCNMSPSYFRARFSLVMGVSPVQFLQSARLQHAGLLLIETQLPIKQIARAAGYSEVKHFYRAFRQRYDCAPLQFRKANAPHG